MDRDSTAESMGIGLLKILQARIDRENKREDESDLRYAIYARKSTTDDERQERSIEDQIDECMKRVVRPNHLRVVDVVKEQQSARSSGIRKQFDALLKRIRRGEIDGIITWHPDRLARNMKDAGEILEMLDKEILRSLKFATFTFDNSPTGKMMLGISFVLSQQYSDHLGESVVRGNKARTEQGIYFDEQKPGYVITELGRLVPDGHNYELMVEAFQKRLHGEAQKDIADWLNSNKFSILRKGHDNHKLYKWDKNRISRALKDPTYAGVLLYGNSLAQLSNFYDFEAAVSEADFMKINNITDYDPSKLTATMVRSRGNSERKANLLRGVVCCGYCGHPFSSGITTKQLKDKKIGYYNYRCETKDCPFYKKSVRARKVLDFAYEFLDEHIFATKGNYRHFRVDMERYISEQVKSISAEIRSTTQALNNAKTDYESSKTLLAQKPELSKHYDLDKKKDAIDKLKRQLADLEDNRESIKQAPISYEDFLELFKSVSVKLRESSDMGQIDEILRIFFSNFTVKQSGAGKQQRCEIAYKLNEPWKGFVANNDFLHGWG